MWARQLYRRLEKSMQAMQAHKEWMRTIDARKVIRVYNKVAACLMEYEVN